MRRLSVPFRPLALFLAANAAAVVAGCAAGPAKPGPPAAPGKPEAYTVALDLKPGQSWTSRFASTSETTRTLRGADGKETVRKRTVGLELVSVQTVESVADGKARVHVREASARILQEGKYVDLPFRPFNPPREFRFSVDAATGRGDFTEMEKAYGDWMSGLKDTPAWDILGRTFRLDAYVAQLKDLYGKPFSRFAGRTLAGVAPAAGERDFVQPFLGPGAGISPVPVEVVSRHEGIQVSDGLHLLKVSGRYAGTMTLTPEEVRDRLAEFQVPPPPSFTSSVAIAGKVASSVDIRTGREIAATSEFEYEGTASFGGSVLREAIKGKSEIAPAK